MDVTELLGTTIAESSLTDAVWWVVLALAVIVLVAALFAKSRRRSFGTVLIILGLVYPAYYVAGIAIGMAAQRDLRGDAPLAFTASVDTVMSSLNGSFGPGSSGVLDWTNYDGEDGVYWGDLRPGGPFSRLVIPSLNLDTVVVNGASVGDLRKGPGWISSTSLPGPTGNCAISGHRTTYQAPFFNLDRLSRGDDIIVVSPYRMYRYRVKGSEVVPPTATQVLAPTQEPTITLIACHPRFSAAQRIVVVGELVEVVRLGSGFVSASGMIARMVAR